MKFILIGYPKSQKLTTLTKELFNKYTGFEILFANYVGEIDGWSLGVRQLLEKIPDRYLGFGLDDYLISSFDPKRFADILMKLGSEVVCARLGDSSEIFTKNPTNEKYCCSTQLAIWEREKLIEILKKTASPWDFEITGSAYMNKMGWYTVHDNIIQYCGESALSERQPGKVSVKGLKKEDVYLALKYFKKEDLIVGQPYGKEATPWQDI